MRPRHGRPLAELPAQASHVQLVVEHAHDGIERAPQQHQVRQGISGQPFERQLPVLGVLLCEARLRVSAASVVDDLMSVSWSSAGGYIRIWPVMDVRDIIDPAVVQHTSSTIGAHRPANRARGR
eukprot:8241140-Pyramimonas_sp.AAC.1